MNTAKRLTSIVLVFFLSAGFGGSVMAESIPYADPGPEAATVIGRINKLSDDIHDVEIIRINGQNLPEGRDIVWLQPGRYDMEVRALIRDTGLARSQRSSRSGENTIEMVLEAGKSYHIGARLDRDQGRSAYSVVVHRVEEREE